ncbi:MAG: lytic murein transglycosylase B [Methylibium sp.]|uniref:lytic murein transglycosylase B n=1 Tax=Methylibium sp. TaxID=2067992 RepID=UPI00180EC056|nr:lytic murein transglycosylase B [Methylibium sp.]MBA3596489.1 lytic murein transglycosylase B [Methylibium sp.]
MTRTVFPPAALAACLVCLAATACAAGVDGPRAVQAPQTSDSTSYGARSELPAMAAGISERRGLDPAWVEATLAKARYEPSVARLIAPPPTTPGTARNWAAYRARFVEPVRIRAGVQFWRDNEPALREAEARWGVPAEIVVGIVGVETLYGRHMGSYRVLDALATLSFDFPKEARRDRSGYFRSELEHYLLLCRSRDIDPLSVLGSYAGASGMPQFMPSSILYYAVDFDGDGRTDLHGSPTDVIGSVANYLAEFGWQPGMNTHYGVNVPVEESNRRVLLAPDILPSFSAAEFTERGAALDAAGRAHQGPLALVEVHNGDDPPSYVAGTQNFYAITRYNQSSYYALAVIELGRAIGTVVEATR